MPITNNEIYELLKEVAESNKKIQKEISDLRQEFSKEIEDLKSQNSNLQKENQELKNRIHAVERQNKKYNLIVYGVGEDIDDIANEIVRIINVVLKINCTQANFRNLHRIGKKIEGKSRSILLELISFQLKEDILRQCRKEGQELKKIGVSFCIDYTTEDYKKHKFLRRHLLDARQKGHTAIIRNDTIIINKETYSYEDLINNLKSIPSLDGRQPDDTEVSNTATIIQFSGTPKTLTQDTVDKKRKPEGSPEEQSARKLRERSSEKQRKQ
ncbi:unnamed protein product [Phaedon cochleariae]|uniref:Endonuclease-reverse transcriptase n=1 Tax=Phaedon cochleariae TaxID=80249 RepID=A0A9N9X237_PHACE|nr:unnamed protein product [Phaedon cochleariae]